MIQTLRDLRLPLFALAILGLLAATSFVVVGEDQQAVIERMGKPDRVVNRFRPGEDSGAGIVAKIPLLEQVIWLPRGLVTYSNAAKRVRSLDQQWLLIDTDVTYRIIDPVRLAGKLGSAAKADAQLQTLLPPLLDQELSQRSAGDIARPGAGGGARALLRGLDAKARQYGIQVVDVRIARVWLDDSGLKATYDRMRERHEAKLFDIQSRSSSEASTIVANAQAEATTRRQQSAAQDPEFYRFFKAMRSYEKMYGNPNAKNTTTIYLPPGSGYLKYMDGN